MSFASRLSSLIQPRRRRTHTAARRTTRLSVEMLEDRLALSGLLYVSDLGTNSIGKFTSGGSGSTFASTGAGSGPWGLAFDSAGNLYTGDYLGESIDKITPGGSVSLFASTGGNRPQALAFDSAGKLYAAYGTTIEKFSSTGTDLGTFASTGLSNAIALAFDSAGNLYAADANGNKIEKYTSGGVGSVFVNITQPTGLAFDAAGNLYAASNSTNTIEKFTPGGVGTLFASTGLNQPYGLAFDSAGNLYTANAGNNTIEDFSSTGTDLGTFANTGSSTSPRAIAFTTDAGQPLPLPPPDAPLTAGALSPPYGNGPLTFSATLTGPHFGAADEAFDSSGNLYVADYNNGTVSKFAPGATTPSATLTGLSNPFALAFDSSGNLFVANRGNSTVSKFAPGATTAGATLTGVADPFDLAFDSSGNLFVSNFDVGTVSKFAPGATTPSATLTGLNGPYALAFDSSGNLFVSNLGTNTVSKFAPGATTPSATLTGLNDPDTMAFDSSGNLYVTNFVAGGTVSVFAPGATTPSATLTGLNGPYREAFDSFGNLFVSNYYGGTVSEFAPGATTPSATLTGFNGPTSLAFGSSGNLFVINFNAGTVSKLNAATPTEGQAFSNETVFHFSDADPNGTASDYTAVVALNGATIATLTSAPSANGQIVAHTGFPSGGFDVQLSYTFPEELTNATFSVTVTDAGGASTSASTSTFNVADAALTANATPVTTAVYATPFSGQVATFIDADPNATLSDFPLANVTIQWGDGGTSNATSITQPGGVGTAFDVFGTYTYGQAGATANPLQVRITDVGGAVSNTTSYRPTVSKASSTTTTVGDGPFTYTGSAQGAGSGTVLGAGTITGSATVTYSANSDGTGTADQTDFGTFYETAHYAGDSNHTGSDGAAVAVSIGKATSSVTATGDSFIYDGTAHTGGSAVVHGAGIVTGSAVLSYSGDQVNATPGAYTVIATYAGDLNHTGSSDSATITIAKATSSVAVTGGTFIYDGTTHTGGSAVVHGAGIVTGSAVLSYSGDQVHAGSYTVTATYAGDANHTGSSASTTMTIQAKLLDATAWSQGTINIGSNGSIVLHIAVAAGQLYGTDTVASLFNGAIFTIKVQKADGSTTYGTLTSTAKVESDGSITVSMQMSDSLRADLYDAYVNGRAVNFNMTATANNGNYAIDEDTMSRLLNNGALKYVV